MREASVVFLDGVIDNQEASAEVVIVFEDEFGEAGGEIREDGGVDVVGCCSGVEVLHAFEWGACEGEIGAQFAFEARQEEGTSNVGKEAYPCLRHGESGVLGSDANGSVDGKTDTAAHGDAVHVGDIWFWVCGNEVIEFIFEAKVLL